MSGHIRRATSADWPRIWEIRLGVKENQLTRLDAVTDEDVAWFTEHPGIWLWAEADKILGFSAADTRDGSVWALFIDPAHHGRGIGRALFTQACTVLRGDGHRTAWLTTSPGTRAEGFYRAAGWKVIGTSLKGELIFHGVL